MKSFTPAPENEPTGLDGLSFRDMAHVVLEKWWLVLICVGVAIGWAVYYQRTLPPVYEATTTLLVDQTEQQIVKVDRLVHEDLRGEESLNTIVQTIQQRSTIERVIDSHRLLDDPRFATVAVTPLTRESAVALISQNLTVRLRRGSRLIDVTFKYSHPAMAALIANALVQEYVQAGAERQLRVTDAATSFLSSEADRLKRKLQESEAVLQSYREKSGNLSLNQQQGSDAPKLMEFSQKVAAARAERVKLESELNQLQALGTNVPALATHARVAEDETVRALRVTLTKAESDFALLKQRYLAKHPKYLQASYELREVQRRFDEAVLQVPQMIAATCDRARATDRSLEAAVRDQEAAAVQFNRAANEYSALNREVETDRALHQSVLSRLKEASLTRQLVDSRLRIVQEATAPNAPLPSGSRGRWARALGGGFILSCFLAVCLNAFDSRIKGVDELERALQLPVLATVPSRRHVGSPTQQPQNEDAGIIEAFRSLRASLQSGTEATYPRTVLFTSALEGEGKTFCATRYAASMARQGFKTLIVDGDLRRPCVERALFGEMTDAPGITEVLSGRSPLSEAVRATELENLHCLSSGTLCSNPAELLGQSRFKALMDGALKEFDCVVVDSAPIHAVSDAFLMLDRMEAVSLVVRAHSTSRQVVARAKSLIERRGVTKLHLVLNRVRTSLLYRSYYYTYGNYSKYGRSVAAAA